MRIDFEDVVGRFNGRREMMLLHAAAKGAARGVESGFVDYRGRRVYLNSILSELSDFASRRLAPWLRIVKTDGGLEVGIAGSDDDGLAEILGRRLGEWLVLSLLAMTDGGSEARELAADRMADMLAALVALDLQPH